jgi:UDPglucose 6-dehydrogenase
VKHLIIGSGTVGYATGIWLEANGEEVVFFDINKNLLDNILKKGHSVTFTPHENDASFIWICTHEKHVPNIVLDYKDTGKYIIVRSTTLPGTIEQLSREHNISHIAHNPEFLRATTSIDDMFNPDRIIIGTHCIDTRNKLLNIYSSLHVPKICTTPTSSELIKLIANSWLSTQISFWNEINNLCHSFKVNHQEIANAVTLDKRISTYGTRMTGQSFTGACLPKDLMSIILLFNTLNIPSKLFNAIKEINEER